MAMLMRAELAQPGTQVVDPGVFNGLFSTHAALMIFVFVIPIFAGLANYVLPLMIGAPDMAFPRLNGLSFWLLPIAGALFLASYLAPGGAFDAGWTGYAPLSTGAPLGQSFFNLGVQFAGASSVATALNFLVTIITMRAPGMNFWRLPLLVWANLSTSLLVVAATPFIAGVQFMVLFDRALGTNFFQAAFGGDVISYQHIFWFYSHPAVYIMMLPGFGIISEVISTHSRKPIFGYRLMALALIGIVVLSYTVWAHHMFVSGMFSWLRVPMMITTLLIAVPTGIKIFSWLGTLFGAKLHLYSTAMLFSLAFIVTFLIGGISGVMLATMFAWTYAAAQSPVPPGYPSRPIRLITTAPAGSPPDLLARIIAEPLIAALGQPVVVDNRPGATGTIGMNVLAKATPDGHTLAIMTLQNIVAPNLVPQLPYDTARDLAPVSQLTWTANILVVRASSPLKSVADYVALAKTKPGQLTYASAGNGTPSHLASELFRRHAGIYVRHVPFKGISAGIAAVLGEHVDVAFAGTATAAPLVRSGKLRALGTAAPVRLPAFPELPTISELGFAGFELREWHGVVAPAGTPANVTKRLANEVARAVALPEVNSRLATSGLYTAEKLGPEPFAALVRSELARWAKLMRDADIRAD